MKKILLSLLSVPAIFSAWSQPWYSLDRDSSSRASWGPDTRAEAKSKFEYRDYTRATATSVQLWQIQGDQVYAPTLKERLVNGMRAHGVDPTGQYKFDENVRFLNQPACGSCTGFLIAPDILVTAGHCMETQGDLDSTIWLFDYTSDVPYNSYTHKLTIPKSNQYHGVEYLDRALLGSRLYDFCIIRLDRKVEGRKPYKFRVGGNVDNEDFLAMIGSPRGLPLKVVDSAKVTNPVKYSNYFLTNLTAFHGNSGGPVFNQNGWIEGILVRGPGDLDPQGGATGDYDFHYDEDCQCIKQDVYYDEYAEWGLEAENGTEVHKIIKTNYPVLLYAVYHNLELAIEDNNTSEFTDWSVYKWAFSMNYGERDEKYKSLDPLVAKAIKWNRNDMVSSILDIEKFDVNMNDVYGTPIACLMARNGMTDNLEKANTKSSGALDLNKADMQKETPLMYAVRSGNMATVEYLLGKHVDVKAQNSAGQTARSIAKSLKYKDIAKRLKKAEKGK